jgi:uncharacterized protein
MRILTISDIHGDFQAFRPDMLPKVDLILIAGDLTNHGFNAPARWQAQALTELEEARAWFEKLSLHCCPQILWVQGNHDKGVPDSFLDPYATNIRDRTVMLTHEDEGIQLSVRGVSLTCAFDKPHLAKEWAFTTIDPSEDTAAFDFGPHNIIVSHGPPFGCLDRTNTGSHIGSPALRAQVLEHQPLLVVCGHVHEAAGMETLGRTTVLNTARRAKVVTLDLRNVSSTA